MSREDRIQKRREYNIEIFKDTLETIGIYDQLDGDVIRTINNTDIVVGGSSFTATRTYKESDGEHTVGVIVNRRRTMKMAGEIYKTIKDNPSKKLCVLNFASATTVGGGVKQGANAQEESICRISTLYPCLSTARVIEEYYEKNRAAKNRLYENICVYTPNIRVFRSDDKDMEMLPEEEWFYTDVITCPAPNLRSEKYNRFNENDIIHGASFTREEYMRALRDRISLIIVTALKHKVTHIVLGAFGCGAFRNDPYIVARTFRDVLFPLDNCPFGFGHMFDEIYFSIYCNDYNEDNFEAFYKHFEDCPDTCPNVYTNMECMIL